MNSRGCAIATVCIFPALGAAAIYFYNSYQRYQDLANPYYQGRRVHDWADSAIEDPDPNKRREAAEALVEAFKVMKPGEPRIQLTMRFCGSRLPKEALPFLIETLHAPEMPPKGYPYIAFHWVDPDIAIPALVEVVAHDEDEHACECAANALSQFGPEAEATLRKVLTDCPEPRRKLAFDSFRGIKREGVEYP